MRFLRFLTLLAIGCLVSMGVAFSVTRVLMRADRLEGGGGHRDHRAAVELRANANDLFDLSERLVEQTAAHPSATEIQPWLTNVYVPELKRLRERIVWEDRLPVTPVRHLEHAIELLLQSAADAANRELRDRALSQVRVACHEVEAYIMAKGVGRLSEPKRKLN